VPLAEATAALRSVTVGVQGTKKKEEVPLEEDLDERCVTERQGEQDQGSSRTAAGRDQQALRRDTAAH